MAEPQPLSKKERKRELESWNGNFSEYAIMFRRYEATVQALEVDAGKWQEFELAYTSWDALPPPNQHYVEMCAELARLRGVEATILGEIRHQKNGGNMGTVALLESLLPAALLAQTNPADQRRRTRTRSKGL